MDYARIAVERGLDEIGCSDHAPLADRETDWTMKKIGLGNLHYVGARGPRENLSTQLPIKLGLEVDYLPGCEDWVRELAHDVPVGFFSSGAFIT